MVPPTYPHVPEGWPLAGPLDSIPTKSRVPTPTKTPLTHNRPDHKADMPPLKEEVTKKGDKKVWPGHSAPPAGVKFPSPTEGVRPSRLPSTGASRITCVPLRTSSLPGRIGVKTSPCQEKAPVTCDGLLVFMIILLLGGLFGGCVLLMQVSSSFLRRIGRRCGWKWVKKSDSVDLDNAIYDLRGHPGTFEEHHLVMLQEILANYGDSSYVGEGEKAKRLLRRAV
ncbi:hypothetical protein F52700_1713 [Fusarium sp. NRRL 52700]|nr:hypothetical protein F52700_1713 [Fusarium sp. NRRL 52700]